MALRLSAEGSGSVKEILEMPADLVINMIHFSKYRSDWERTDMQLNKDSKP